METDGLSTLQLLLFIVAAPALLVLIVVGLVLLLRRQTQNTVDKIGERIQGFDHRISEIAKFLRSYTSIDKEPYSTQLDELQTEAAGLHTQVQAFLHACQGFEEATRQAGDNRFQEIINAPVNGVRQWRQASSLLAESKTIDSQLSAAEEHMQRIYELPIELAQQCIQAEKDAAELFKAVQDLQQKGAYGAALNLINSQVPQIKRGLEEIPETFYHVDADTLLAVNNRKPTIRVFEVLSSVRPALARYLPQVREWNAAYDRASAEYNQLKVAGANLRQVMSKPPAGLETTALEERLDQIAQLAADLNQRLAQPEVEDLKPLAREISQVRRVIEDTEKQFSQAAQQVDLLSRVLGELQVGLDKLAAQMGDLERIGAYPLAWDESNGLIKDQRKRLAALGPAGQPRTPEQVAQHLKDAEQLRARYKTHADAFPKTAEQHRALITLLEGPELREGAAYLRKAREMLNQAAVYDPHNYSKTDSIQTMPGDLEDLLKFHEDLVPTDRAAPIRESELSVRLQDTKLLADQHKHLRPRIESVQKRLAKIQELEKSCKAALTEAFGALDRMEVLAENNDLLYQSARQEIDRLKEEIQQLGSELNNRQQGEVEKKTHKINAQIEKVIRALNGWLAHLNGSIATLGSQMNGRLSQVDAIAALDDTLIADTRELLARDEYVSAIYGSRGSRVEGSAQTGALRSITARVAERGGMLPRQQVPLNELDVIAEIKRKNDLWLTLESVSRALNERTDSLLEAQEDMVKARSAAHEALAEVARRIPERRAWPPNNQTPLTEAQFLHPIDSKRDALKKQPRRVDAAIYELGHLTQQYSQAAEHARQRLDRVTQDEERIQDLEERIGEIKQRWQAHGQANPANAVMREGIQQVVSQADSKLAYIKQQYMRGVLSYEQVIRSLQLLYDELYASRVSIDDKNDIGLNQTHALDPKRPINQH